MDLADEHQANSVDIFTFLSREAEKRLRWSAGLSVQSAFDGSSPVCQARCTSAHAVFARSSPCSEATPDELEQRLRFYGRQIKSLRTTSLMYSSPDLMKRIRQIERDYETAVRLFYCRPPSPTSSHMSAAVEQPTSGLQSAAVEQPTSGLQSAAAAVEQPTSGLQSAAAAVEQPTSGLQSAAAAVEQPTPRQVYSLLESFRRGPWAGCLHFLNHVPKEPEAGLPPLRRHVPEGPEGGLPPRPGPEHLLGFLWGVLTELRPDAQPDSRPESPQPGMTPDPKSASTSSTRRRGRRKRGALTEFIEGLCDTSASAHATEGLCDASAPAHTTEGLCDASAPAHATEGLGDASAPAHATEGLGDASAPAHTTGGPGDASTPAHANEGPGDASAPAHATEGPGDASAPAHATEGPGDASAPAHATEGNGDASASVHATESFVLILASEPRDEGFEEEAPPDPVSVPEGFKEQFVLLLASEPRDEGSPGASEGSPGSASASEGSPGSQLTMRRLASGLRNSTEFLGDPLLCSVGLLTNLQVPVTGRRGLHAFAANRPGLCVAGPGARLNSAPAGDDLLVARLNSVFVSVRHERRGEHEDERAVLDEQWRG
ncbi:hypothetical protein CRENBAI_004425 [Crenichthys baileyi]|uniref:Uncharacterized protein n=1 Tax=Crenichthys baileyi TaxID=28760 RepID=A0AAV9QMU2_9TELE